MSLQIINSVDGNPEYVLLPIAVYNRLKLEIKSIIINPDDDYETFDVKDYVENPVALARIKSHITQAELARLLGVSQAYISKIENQETVSPKLLERVNKALSSYHPK